MPVQCSKVSRPDHLHDRRTGSDVSVGPLALELYRARYGRYDDLEGATRAITHATLWSLSTGFPPAEATSREPSTDASKVQKP